MIRAKGKYADIYGYAYSLDESFDIRAWWESLIKTGHILRRYYKDREYSERDCVGTKEDRGEVDRSAQHWVVAVVLYIVQSYRYLN